MEPGRWLYGNTAVHLTRVRTVKRQTQPLTADVVGHSCFADLLVPAVELPEVQRGDMVALLETGAYQESSASNFNALARPGTVLVCGSQADVIRRAETEQDVWARDTVPARPGGHIMTSSVWLWLLALWMLATAAGIAIYWASWFRTPHEQTWLPVGYHEHERVFVFPDSLLATLLTVTAVLTITEHDLAPGLGLVAAGMLTFLGVIDAAYFAQHGLFTREREGPLNLFIVVAVLALASVLVAVGLS